MGFDHESCEAIKCDALRLCVFISEPLVHTCMAVHALFYLTYSYNLCSASPAQNVAEVSTNELEHDDRRLQPSENRKNKLR